MQGLLVDNELQRLTFVRVLHLIYGEKAVENNQGEMICDCKDG